MKNNSERRMESRMKRRLFIVNLNPCFDHWILLDRRPEIPDVMRGEAVVHQIDGKGLNIARVLGILGCTDYLCLNVLGGSVGRIIADKARTIGIPAVNVWIKEESRINTALIHRRDERRGVQMINESGPSITADEAAEIKSVFSKLVRSGDTVVVSGSAPQGFEPEDLREIARIAARKGAELAVDIAGEPLKALVQERPAVLKVNNQEIHLAFGIDPFDIDTLKKFQNDRGIGQFTITYGARGSVTVTCGRIINVKPPVLEADYAVGSGDAFFAGCLFGYTRSMEITESLRIAAACGAANAAGFGAALITREEYETYLPRISVTEGAYGVLSGR